MNTTKSDKHSAPYMTKIEGCPDRSSVRAGMAHYCNSGPPGATCGSCQHIDRVIRKGASKARCVMFERLTGRKGELIDPKYPSCKYFELRPRKLPTARHNQSASISAAEAELLRTLHTRAPPSVK
jgi:hypothetical protein